LVPWKIGKSNSQGIITDYVAVDWTSKISGIHDTNSGNWFVDSLIHLFIPAGTGTSQPVGFKVYETHATNSNGTDCTSNCDLLHWSDPVEITINASGGGAQTNTYDPSVFLIGGVYYMWLTHEVDHIIYLASASSLLGPYTVIKSSSTFGWATNYEGPKMFSTGATSWRLTLEQAVTPSAGDYHAMYYSDCDALDISACTWTALKLWHEDQLYRHGTVVKNF